MAQQTINVGTAPNDGTGTPLRTAFQYTNSNFSELYTAVGPSGNNIVVPGNATITGDLTVDTSTLKVDSANNRVGIGTASPLNALHVLGSTTGNVGRIVGGGSGQPLFLYSDNSGSGVNNGSNGSYGTGLYFSNASNFLAFYTDTGSGGTEKARIDTSGNVGIGVTPSAWSGSFKAIDIGSGCLVSQPGNQTAGIFANSFANGTNYTRKALGTAAGYDIYNGAHYWLTAASGAAGSTFAFGNAKMTLDASGNLLVGPTSANTSGGVLQLSSGITFPATQVASSDANTLDDYEEGTFTPIVLGTTSAGTGTYSGQVGRYTKVGNLVTAHVYLAWTAHTGTGNMRFGGLPFAASSDANSNCSVTFGYVQNMALTAGNILTGFTSVSNTFIDCYQTPSGGGASTSVPIDTDAIILYSVSYRV